MGEVVCKTVRGVCMQNVDNECICTVNVYVYECIRTRVCMRECFLSSNHGPV